MEQIENRFGAFARIVPYRGPASGAYCRCTAAGSAGALRTRRGFDEFINFAASARGEWDSGRIMRFMFFRREKPRTPTFAERLEKLRDAGFTVAPAGGATRVSRGGCAVDLKESGGAVTAVARAGMRVGGEIGALVDGGFQKFFRTADGKKKPATAAELKDLHDFEEDLKEALGQESYYNESLGTVSTYYLYDRVKDRDRGVPKRVWE
jgi:hypothetical protein